MKRTEYKNTTDAHHSVATTLKPLLVVGLLFWIPVVVFAKLAFEVRDKQPLGLDMSILHAINHFSNSSFDTLAILVTQAGGGIFIILATIFCALYVLRLKHKKDALLLITAVGGVAGINAILKVLFRRDRPNLWHPLVTEHSYSFPSGHAMASSALALSFVVIFWRTQYRWLVLPIAGVYILVVGLSRLYLGVHYPTDIVAGWCVSLVWVLLVRMIITRFSHSSTYAALRKRL